MSSTGSARCHRAAAAGHALDAPRRVRRHSHWMPTWLRGGISVRRLIEQARQRGVGLSTTSCSQPPRAAQRSHSRRRDGRNLAPLLAPTNRPQWDYRSSAARRERRNRCESRAGAPPTHRLIRSSARTTAGRIASSTAFPAPLSSYSAPGLSSATDPPFGERQAVRIERTDASRRLAESPPSSASRYPSRGRTWTVDSIQSSGQCVPY